VWNLRSGLIQLQANAQRRPGTASASTAPVSGQLVAVGFYRLQRKALVVEHFVDGVMHASSSWLANSSPISWWAIRLATVVSKDQWLAKVFDVQVVDLFDKRCAR
jgi:hypothetical protein